MSHTLVGERALATSPPAGARTRPVNSLAAMASSMRTPATAVTTAAHRAPGRARPRRMAAAAATSQGALASRVTGLKNEGAYAVLAAAQALEAQGRDVVHLEIGQPAYPTPDHVVEAGLAEINVL